MAGEALLEASQVLASFPDNTSGLIEAVDMRSFVVSVTPGVAFLEDDPAGAPYTIPITDGVPTDVLSTIGAVNLETAFNFAWQLDGNGAIIPDYSGVIINPGTERMVTGSLVVVLEKTGGGQPDSYILQGTEGGVFTGNPRTIEVGTTPEAFVFSGTRVYDVSVGGALSFSITGDGTNDDLELSDMRVALESVML